MPTSFGRWRGELFPASLLALVALICGALVVSTPLAESPALAIGAALLLVVPVLYLGDSAAAAILYLAGAGAWLIATRLGPGHALGYWIFLGLAAPPVISSIRRSTHSDDGTRAAAAASRGRTRAWLQGLLAFSAVSSLAAGILYSLEIRVRDVAAVLFPALSSALLLAGLRSDRDPASLAFELSTPARWLGGLGVAVSLVLYTGQQAWGFAGEIDAPGIGGVDLVGTVTLALGLTGYSIHAMWREAHAGRWHLALVGAYPLVVLPGLAIIHLSHSKLAASALMAGYAFAIAALALAIGTRDGSRAARWCGGLLGLAIVLNLLRQ